MQELWNGFAAERFTLDGRDAIVVFPHEGKSNGRLALKTEYWDAFPATEAALLEEGFHLCYIKNDNRWGTDSVLDAQAALIRYVSRKYHLQTKVVPVGMSCGGLIAVKLAAKYPELVSCLYLDAPALDYRTLGSQPTLDEALRVLNLDSVCRLDNYPEMALNKIPLLIDNRIPVVLVAGDSDSVVPYLSNGALLESAYRDAGIPIEVYIKPGCEHHPHGLEDPAPVVQFAVTH